MFGVPAAAVIGDRWTTAATGESRSSPAIKARRTSPSEIVPSSRPRSSTASAISIAPSSMHLIASRRVAPRRTKIFWSRAGSMTALSPAWSGTAGHPATVACGSTSTNDRRSAADDNPPAYADAVDDRRADPDVSQLFHDHTASEQRARRDVSVSPDDAVVLDHGSSIHDDVLVDRRACSDHRTGQDDGGFADRGAAGHDRGRVDNGREPESQSFSGARTAAREDRCLQRRRGPGTHLVRRSRAASGGCCRRRRSGRRRSPSPRGRAEDRCTRRLRPGRCS